MKKIFIFLLAFISFAKADNLRTDILTWKTAFFDKFSKEEKILFFQYILTQRDYARIRAYYSKIEYEIFEFDKYLNQRLAITQDELEIKKLEKELKSKYLELKTESEKLRAEVLNELKLLDDLFIQLEKQMKVSKLFYRSMLNFLQIKDDYNIGRSVTKFDVVMNSSCKNALKRLFKKNGMKYFILTMNRSFKDVSFFIDCFNILTERLQSAL